MLFAQRAERRKETIGEESSETFDIDQIGKSTRELHQIGPQGFLIRFVHVHIYSIEDILFQTLARERERDTDLRNRSGEELRDELQRSERRVPSVVAGRSVSLVAHRSARVEENE